MPIIYDHITSAPILCIITHMIPASALIMYDYMTYASHLSVMKHNHSTEPLHLSCIAITTWPLPLSLLWVGYGTWPLHMSLIYEHTTWP